jgi:glutathione S-transferase
MPQLLLFCALDLERRVPEFDWRDGRPALRNWFDGIASLPAVTAPLPPDSA